VDISRDPNYWRINKTTQTNYPIRPTVKRCDVPSRIQWAKFIVKVLNQAIQLSFTPNTKNSVALVFIYSSFNSYVISGPVHCGTLNRKNYVNKGGPRTNIHALSGIRTQNPVEERWRPSPKTARPPEHMFLRHWKLYRFDSVLLVNGLCSRAANLCQPVALISLQSSFYFKSMRTPLSSAPWSNVQSRSELQVPTSHATARQSVPAQAGHLVSISHHWQRKYLNESGPFDLVTSLISINNDWQNNDNSDQEFTLHFHLCFYHDLHSINVRVAELV
jgi:hypothetical protein